MTGNVNGSVSSNGKVPDKARCFLQLNEQSIWEEVDSYIFENWKNAILIVEGEPDAPRYNGNRFFVSDGKVFLDFKTTLTAKDLAIIARLSGATSQDFTFTQPGGFAKDPEYVMIKFHNRTILKKNFGPAFKATAQ
jgi:Ni,Fe-hydrogenase I small subunit